MSKTINTTAVSGFSGIWYGNQAIGGPYYFKYSGGLGTYPQQHAPVAIYDDSMKRTYFVFGSSTTFPSASTWQQYPQGTPPGNTICAISYFDHTTKMLARPRELMRRDVLDAHENPVLTIDNKGHIVVFCPAHGSGRPSFILRSQNAHDITIFETVAEFAPEDNFSYPQPWWIDGKDLIFLHTFYEQGKWRRLAIASSSDSKNWQNWSQRRTLVSMAKGSYQISWPDRKGGIGTAFDMHPDSGNDAPLNHRTNLYYMHSKDGGQTWDNASGNRIDTPLSHIKNPALVYDGQSQGKLVYLKDLQYDQQNNPVIVYLTATSAMPGPNGGPHQWRLAKHDGAGWQHFDITTTTHCYDHGSLLLLEKNDWRLIAPTEPGIDQYAAGGQVQMWQSTNQGETWRVIKNMTDSETTNHTYARRPLNAHQDFACLWADGRGYEPSQSSLYFCDCDGQVFQMPPEIRADFVKPKPI